MPLDLPTRSRLGSWLASLVLWGKFAGVAWGQTPAGEVTAAEETNPLVSPDLESGPDKGGDDPELELDSLSPTFETPSERRETLSRPAFETPSQQAAPKTKSNPKASATVKSVSPDEGRDDKHRAPPESLPKIAGVSRRSANLYMQPLAASWVHQGSGGIAAPLPGGAQGESAKPIPRAVAYLRGFYSYYSDDLPDASGGQLIAFARITDGFRASALYHHEFRHERAAYGMVAMTAELPKSLEMTGHIAVGNGAYYVPVVSIEAELSGNIAAWLRYGIGGGTSLWSLGRRRAHGSAALMFELPRDVDIIVRTNLGAIGSRVAKARFEGNGALELRYLDHGRLGAYVRAAGGVLPRYGIDFDLDVAENRTFIDVELGYRHWLGRRYGLIGNADYGWQHKTYHRAGASLGVFVEI